MGEILVLAKVEQLGSLRSHAAVELVDELVEILLAVERSIELRERNGTCNLRWHSTKERIRASEQASEQARRTCLFVVRKMALHTRGNRLRIVASLMPGPSTLYIRNPTARHQQAQRASAPRSRVSTRGGSSGCRAAPRTLQLLLEIGARQRREHLFELDPEDQVGASLTKGMEHSLHE